MDTVAPNSVNAIMRWDFCPAAISMVRDSVA